MKITVLKQSKFSTIQYNKNFLKILAMLLVKNLNRFFTQHL